MALERRIITEKTETPVHHDEEWRDVNIDEGKYIGRYKVSNKGRVRSLSRFVTCRGGYRRSKGKFIVLSKNNCGYYGATLYRDGNPKKFSVHRLVAMAFIDNPENKREVNHKDGIKTNNIVENLEWMTSSENTMHSYDNGLQNRGSGVGTSKLTDKDVLRIRSLYPEYSHRKIAKMYGVYHTTIGRIVTRKLWKHI